MAGVTARVYKSTGSWYVVQTELGAVYQARIKGKFKIDKAIRSTNPIAVGDWIEMDIEAVAEETGIITHIMPRKNYLIRSSPHNRFQKHIVASNLDQSILIATLKEPRTSLGFIDRFLVSCEAYHIPAVLLFNKADLLNEEELKHFADIRAMYEAIGYPVYLFSAEQGSGLSELHTLLQNKTSLFTGHSGVGKSTFINKLMPERDLRIQEVSEWSGKGMHTTTFAEMYNLPDGGAIIDTPGIRELGIIDISKQELSGYFPEMRAVQGNCKYNNCTHLIEPGCAVKEAVREGSISEERYISYAKIYDSIEERNY